MTNPEQREKIARDVLEDIEQMPLAASNVPPEYLEGWADCIATVRTRLAAIIALDPAPESASQLPQNMRELDLPVSGVFAIGEPTYTPRPAPDVEAMARVLYCAMEKVSAPENEAHLSCYFAPFNEYATDETKAMFDEYRVGARAVLATLARSSGS